MQWGVKSAARPPRRAPVVIFYRHHDARPPQRAPRPARATDVIQPGGRVIHLAQHRPSAAAPPNGGRATLAGPQRADKVGAGPASGTQNRRPTNRRQY